ncbi:MAG: permease [Thermoanaerobaculia bacterium]
MDRIAEALQTSAGMLWKALWALIFGYLISAGIQVIVSREQMARVLGRRGAKEAALAGFFGFVSSSCSFAALAASRSVFVKGAHAANAIAFLIASTNLVLELGIVLYVLLGWHFLAGNLLVGCLMIVYAYVLTRLWLPRGTAERACARAEERLEHEGSGETEKGMRWTDALTTRDGWRRITERFVAEWRMVWKEILFGFTVAGLISVYVPQRFWDAVLLGGGDSPGFGVVLENVLVAPVIAFFTFIGSMGNVPLAAMLWSKGASFGGVMSFLGADLVAATVVWIHAKYYGWRYAGYVSLLLYASMVAAGITVHYLFLAIGVLPTERRALAEMVAFRIDYTFWLNVVFVTLAVALLVLRARSRAARG